MIKLIDTNGQAHFLAASAIASVSETGTSSQWHGIRAIVRTVDGRVIEVSEPASDIAGRVEKEEARAA